MCVFTFKIITRKEMIILNIKDIIIEYINTYENNEPIFMDDIK